MSRRGSVFVAAASLSVGLVAPSGADAAPVGVRMWRVYRVGTAPAALDMTVRVTPTGPRDMVLILAVRGSGVARTVPEALFAESGSTMPVVYGTPAGTVTLCPTAPGCATADPLGGGEHSLDTEGRRVRDVYLIVTQNAAAAVEFALPGWRVREVAPTHLTRRMEPDNGGTGGATTVASVESFTGATARGGRHGSFAWAFLPCNEAGSGSARLRASRPLRPDPAVMRCGPHGSTVVSSAASASVTQSVAWEVAGSSVGVGRQPTRLLVIDLPAA